MSGFYGIDSNREVIRVHVKKCDGLMQPDEKKFSIDPQITSYEMLQNILAKAFDIKSDFTISYLSKDNGQEVYLSMLSDWDMDAAFQNASYPCLRLKVDLKPFDEGLEDWDIIAPVEIPQFRMAFLDKGTFLGNITGNITTKVGHTVSSFQRAIGMKSDDSQLYKPIKSAMNDMEFRNYLDSDGHMVKPEEFRLSIYQGGVEPSLRRVVWRHLLNIFPEDLSGRERFDYMKRKENEYYKLRDNWRDLFSQRQVSDEAKHVASLVKKDVLRTDRTHKFYAGGDDSKNLISLYYILVTYALTHPEVSYCQGMSDLASPLLVVQKDEAQAYLCFCGLMNRLRSNFLYNGEAITTKLQHLSALVHFYDPHFHVYMKEHGAEDLFFCYRWLLLEMKREFPFEDALYMLEVMWSTLPPDPPAAGLDLKDSDYCLDLMLALSPNSPTVALKQTQYSHLLAKRRNHISTKKEITGPMSSKVLVSPKFREALLKESDKQQQQDHNNSIKVVTAKSAVERNTESCSKNDSDNCLKTEPSNSPKDDIDKYSKTNNDNYSQLYTDKCSKIDNDNHSKLYTDKCSKTDKENYFKVDTYKYSNTNTNKSSRVDTVYTLCFDSSSENLKESEDEKTSVNEGESSNCVVQDNTEQDKISLYSETGSAGDSKDSKSEEEIFSREVKPVSKKSVEDKETSCKDCGSCGKDDSPDKFESANTSIASSLSNSYSVERFPSLISCSIEDEKVLLDDDIEVISSGEQFIEPTNNDMDENDDQAQFHLSLEKNESENLKKKSGIPQIKGSFFSGMRKILSSPKRRPGKAIKVNGNANVITDGSADNQAVRSQSCQNISSGKIGSVRNTSKRNSCEVPMGVSPDGESIEHTLFELNLAKSHNGEKLDGDSGNGSLTSSTNSSHVSVNKLKGSNKTNDKGKLILDMHKANGKVNEMNAKNKDMSSMRDCEISNDKHVDLMINEIPEDKYPMFCENHFDMENTNGQRSDEAKENGVVSDCLEVVDNQDDEISRLKQLPAPELFGYGNPFLMFICLTVLLQHREMVMKANMEYDELAMYFDKMVRKHNVHKVLNQARQLYTDYIRMQQNALCESKTESEADFSV